jgi:hypothetical protein
MATAAPAAADRPPEHRVRAERDVPLCAWSLSKFPGAEVHYL